MVKTALRDPFPSNTHETIARLHDSFAVLFSQLFSGHASNPSGPTKKG